MSERIRLTIAAAVTTLLLAAASLAGLALHTGSPTPRASASAPAVSTTQAAHAAPTTAWHEELD